MNKNLKNIGTILAVLIVTIVIISSSSISITLNKISKEKNLDEKLIYDKISSITEPSIGLAPKAVTSKFIKSPFIKNKEDDANLNIPTLSYPFTDYIRGYIANSSVYDEGTCCFDPSDPGYIEFLHNTESDDFLSGGTGYIDSWLACENSSGALWMIDWDTGEMIPIGGGGIGLTGLAYDMINNRLYGSSDSSLYEIDPEIGEQTYIGPFTNGVSLMIGIACDHDGTLYGWDIGTDNLWIIDKETAECTLIGPLGIDINYAQDGCFDHDDGDVFYLTAYTTSAQLYTCDKETGACTIVGSLEGNSQITASVVSICYCVPPDVGVKNIICPESGYALPEIPMKVLVKNYGVNTESTDVKMQVNIYENGLLIFEEYNETVEDVVIPPGPEGVLVDFPSWTPSDWQNTEFENKWQEYYVKACTLLKDYKSENNCKEKIIDLYYPWTHDIEITSIDSPSDDGPGKTYPVQAAIKNVGQYPECCIPIYINIAESVILDTSLNEKSWANVPPLGWTDEHKNYSSDYGWKNSKSSNSGGSSPEAKLPYTHALADYVFYSYALNTSDIPFCNLEFLSYISHYYGSGLYTLEAGYSHDGETWIAAWSEAPCSSGRYNVSVTIKIESETTYIGFWIKGDPWYMNHWYLDNIVVKAVDILEDEYSDYMCQGPDLEPGETRIFEFDDWTPDFLQYETTGTKDYIIQAEIDMEDDKNPGNDLLFKHFNLDYWHDVKIRDITSPSIDESHIEEWLHFDDGTNVNAIGGCAGCPWEYAIRLTPEELGDWAGYSITSVKRHHGYNDPFSMNGRVKIYTEGTDKSPGELITEQPFSCYWAGWHEIILEEPVDISGDKDIWVSIEVTHNAGEYPAGMDPVLNYPGKGDWASYNNEWYEIYIYGFNCDWNLWAGIDSTGWCYKKAYIQPGIQDINVTVANCGTFPELDLTCRAEIYDLIQYPENGTLVYEDNITDIDLEETLGFEKILNFKSYNFTEEGLYYLYLNIPDDNDDYLKNNEDYLLIGADATCPITAHVIYPFLPDGDNGWYASDVEVTLEAIDPSVLGVSSGVKEIRYKINGGAEQTIMGDYGTFVIYEDGNDISVEYWAIDNVGNVESHNTFTIDMDQTDPEIDLIYEWQVNPDGSGGWLMTFTARAIDETSKMGRVEFYLNDVIQNISIGSGPTYTWKFIYHGGLKMTIFAEAYDNAGNMASDEIVNPENINANKRKNNDIKNLQFLQKPANKIFSILSS